MTPSAAARFSLLAAEFKECLSVILATDGLGKDTERYVHFVVRYRYFYKRFVFVVSALIFYIMYIPLFLVKGKTIL